MFFCGVIWNWFKEVRHFFEQVRRDLFHLVAPVGYLLEQTRFTRSRVVVVMFVLLSIPTAFLSRSVWRATRGTATPLLLIVVLIRPGEEDVEPLREVDFDLGYRTNSYWLGSC